MEALRGGKLLIPYNKNMRIEGKTIKTKSLSEFDECPYCGCDTFYTKEYYSGHCYIYERFDGQETDNGSIYELAKHKKSSKYAFCAGCNEKIAKYEDE